MGAFAADPGSWRDVAGRVFRSEDRVLRLIAPAAAEDYDFVRGTGLLDELAATGRAVAALPVDAAELGPLAAGAHAVVEHPRLPFISYPYEWSFQALKAAALLHLDVHLDALKAGVTLSDASAYNVQFRGARPVFIDTLSFRRYREGEFWAGYRQFCEQFLNPLLLRALCGVPHNAWYRGALEGIPTAELKRLLPFGRRFSRRVLTHVVLHAALAGAGGGAQLKGADVAAGTLPLAAFRRMLEGLRDWIAGLTPARAGASTWQDYETTRLYGDDQLAAKRAFVRRFAAAVRPGLAFDLGCNAGEFSGLLLEGGAGTVIGWDSDQNALDQGFARAADADLAFTPLYGDAANPSPGQGWAGAERPGWIERGRPDAVLALALVHHLAIGRNVPLDKLVPWLVGVAPVGVVEFVPKSDPQVRKLLELRPDIFPDYTLDAFLGRLQAQAGIVATETLSPGGRTLIWFDAKARP